MKVVTALVAVLVLFLLGGAAFRVATMTPDTEPLIDLGLVERDAAPKSSASAPAEEGKFGEVGTGAKVAGSLKGNAWEKESAAPASNMTETEESDAADKAVDDREGDLQNAKNRIKGRL